MRLSVLRSTVAAASIGVMLCAAQPALAGAVSRDDFSFPAETGLNVVVFRPDVHVGSLKVGGLDEPDRRMDRSRARQHAGGDGRPRLNSATPRSTLSTSSRKTPTTKLLNEYRGLFEAVAGSMFTHVTNSGRCC